MGEGSGVVILEELEHAKARGAKIYAEVVGYGCSSDAYHITSPQEDGAGAARAMTNAMSDAGVTPADVNTSMLTEQAHITMISLRQEQSSLRSVMRLQILKSIQQSL